MKDERIVYGATCMWWDDIYHVGTAGGTMTVREGQQVNVNLPVCPKCGGVLMEAENIESWMAAAKHVEDDGHAGYIKFIEWSRGKCFPSRNRAIEVYNMETGEIIEDVYNIGKNDKSNGKEATK